MGGLVLACGERVPVPLADDSDVVRLPARPEKHDVDPLLRHDHAEHLIVAGTDADLAAVVLRLLRKNKLATTRVGFVPAWKRSAFARRWRLPHDPERAVALARQGAARGVPLIRDDAGGVLLGRGVVTPVRAVVYCDDQPALRGQARALEVTPSDPEEAGLRTLVTRKGLTRRRASYTSRAVALGCDPQAPATPCSDGVSRERPSVHWTWYRHTEDLRLIGA